MTDTADTFAADNATITMSNELKDAAVRMAAETGGDPAPALFGAAMKALDDQFGKGTWAPLARRWLQTVIDAENGPPTHN